MKIERKTQRIDATGKILGRLATEVALILRGKNKPTFAPNIDSGDIVIISNVGKIKITGNKLNDKLYRHYSGYLGGLKSEKMSNLMNKNPKEIFKLAVLRMLPKNRMQKQVIKKLKFE
jgi:large subunit ribosomal protein L13